MKNPPTTAARAKERVARRSSVHAALRASKIIFIFLKKVVDEKSSL